MTVQTGQCLENVEAILASEGVEISDPLKVTIHLGDIDDLEEMNETYAEFFDDEPPARSAIEVGAVPKGATLEIESVAIALARDKTSRGAESEELPVDRELLAEFVDPRVDAIGDVLVVRIIEYVDD